MDNHTARDSRDGSPLEAVQNETDRQLRERAEKELRRLMSKVDEGIHLETGRVTVESYLSEWLDGKKPDLSPSTAVGYAAMFRDHVNPVIGKKVLRQLQPGDVRRIYTRMAEAGSSGNTRLHVHRALSQALKAAVRDGKASRNVCELVDAPRVGEYSPHEITIGEARKLLIAADETRSGVIVRLLAFTGLRLGEALGLRWRDLDLESMELHVRQTRKLRGRGTSAYGPPKTKRSSRDVDLDPVLVELPKRHRDQQREHYEVHGLPAKNALVFTDHLGRRLAHDHVFHD